MISSIDFSTVLRLFDMHTLDQISRIGEWMLKVNKVVGEVSNAYHGSNQLSMGLDNHNLQKCSW
jgi:hypothetical protein